MTRHAGFRNKMIWSVLTRDSEALFALDSPGLSGMMKAEKMEEITSVSFVDVAMACSAVDYECNPEELPH